jgi:hypothetical protein
MKEHVVCELRSEPRNCWTDSSNIKHTTANLGTKPLVPDSRDHIRTQQTGNIQQSDT